MNRHSHGDGKKHERDSQQVQLETTLLERMEESRADLKADRKHEEDQAEILHEVHDGRVHPQAEMAQKDGHKQNPRRTNGNTFDLELAKIQSDRNHDCENQNRMGYSSP